VSKREKLLKRFLSKPRDFAWSELVTLLNDFGYESAKGGKTGGSRARFANNEIGVVITLHKPHSPSVLKGYQIDQIIAHLKDQGLVS
jgi:hypothetical protein